MRRCAPSVPLSLAAILTALLIVSACGDPLGPERGELEQARARWESTGPSDYTYAIERLCFCGFRGPARVTVENGAVASIAYLTVNEPPEEVAADLFPAVDGLFDILEDAIAREAHSITATYDPDTGVPTDFFIDYEENVSDEELGMRVTEPVTPLEGG